MQPDTRGTARRIREDAMSLRRGMTAVLFAVLLGAVTQPVQAQNYHIGALLPNSGPMTQFGQLFSNGADLAADHVNADKLLSKPFVIDHEDSQGQPQPAVTGMNKLVRVNQEPMVLTAQSGVSKAVAPIGEREHVVTINGGGVAPDLAKLGPYFFNVIPLVNYEVRALMPYLAKEKKFKRIAIVYVEDPLGDACLAEIKENAPKNGMELVGAFSVPSTSRQFAPIAAKIREVKPDVVFVAYYGQTMVALVKQLRDAGVDAPFTSYSGFDDPDLKALPAAEGSIYSSQKMDWASTDPVTARFVKDFKKKYGKDPTFYNANYYNAVWVTAKSMASLEKKGQPVTGETLRNEILAIKTFDAVGGKMEFQPDGTVSMPMQINELIKGGSKILQ
jgi:ABC-type branched-subunit amino acid transport system substrate-binding protein